MVCIWLFFFSKELVLRFIVIWTFNFLHDAFYFNLEVFSLAVMRNIRHNL